MNTETIVKEQQEAQTELHQQWLQHPVTKQMIYVIEIHEKSLVDYAVANAESLTVSEVLFRNQMVSTRAVRAVKKLIVDTQLFTKTINNNKQ